MNGVLLVDKPSGLTSRDVVNIVCKVLNTKKVGHTGTLDPLATGVLVVTIGRATKLGDIFINDDKEYIAEATLGVLTNTLDAEGDVLKRCAVSNIPREKLISGLKEFLGKQSQEVPLFSSVKINGKKLYEYARNNEKVILPIREINIKSIELVSDIIHQDEKLIFKIKCLVSKGTYIRSLVRDIGNYFGYPAYMSNLRRIKQGLFNIDECYSIADIQEGKYNILSIKDALRGYPTRVVDEIFEKKILNGMKLNKFFSEEKILLINKKGEAIAIYTQDEDNSNIVKPLKILKTLDF